MSTSFSFVLFFSSLTCFKIVALVKSEVCQEFLCVEKQRQVTSLFTLEGRTEVKIVDHCAEVDLSGIQVPDLSICFSNDSLHSYIYVTSTPYIGKAQ